MTRFHLLTLGCKINFYEADAIAQAWEARGDVRVDDAAEADVVLVNTCAVTAKAVRDSRQTVYQALRSVAESAEVLVTGCAAQVVPEEFQAMQGVARVIGQQQKARLLTYPQLSPAPDESSRTFPPFSIASCSRARPVIKVGDGCSHGCTYCIVPSTRGPARSRAPEDVLAEVERLLTAGHRELVLSGINLRQYRPRRGYDFWSLVGELTDALAGEWSGRARLRLSSVDPAQLTGEAGERLLTLFGRTDFIAPHLHVALQSGSPAVLAAMGRDHYDPAEVAATIGTLRDTLGELALGADILTGFPSETEEQFAEGLAYFTALPLTHGHVFPYSRRPGTPAARLPQPPREVRTRRAAELRALVEAKHEALLQRLLERDDLTVCLERQQGDTGEGVCEFYVPCRVAHVPPDSRARLVRARPVGRDGGTLCGEHLPEG